ncbi:MAG: sodium-translocating pyrophosphatase [Chloroflexi bacterium]|jgi:K(+)-stimulated pyrophosphate-energized sodium pump|nr:sodium-translocating pyrophosphatase [Chloroflexota bacterium]
MWIVPAAGILAVVVAAYLAWDVLGRDQGPEEMQEVAGTIYEGAVAFLNRQYRTIALLSVVGAIGISALLGFIKGGSEGAAVAWHTGIAFVIGAVCSGIAGLVGMFIAVKANLRTAAAARTSLGDALTIALRGGAVSGLLVVAMSLLGVYGLFEAFRAIEVANGAADPLRNAPSMIVGFGFGASFVALFAQLGGGIYTKAADVGADLVGKVEAGIPEDDPRNPAVIADLVGDNVGDCAGRGADLFESTAAENIGAMILGVTIYGLTKNPAYIFFPLVVRAFGLLASIVGIFSIRTGGVVNTDGGRSAQAALDVGYWVTAGLSVVGMYIATVAMFGTTTLFWAGLVGILTSVVFVYITQYYTAGSWRPVQLIADASRTGPATNIIAGFAIALENTAAPTIAISIALFASYQIGVLAGPELGLGADTAAAGIYGTAIATMGMLMSAGYILAMDTFGPITDNAGGIVEMSHQDEHVRHNTDALDSVGNTTKALTKGYAIGSAALAAFLLFSAFLDEVKVYLKQTGEITVNIAKVEVFVGGFLGAMLVFLFSSFAIRAVGKAAGAMIEEVRRQFRADPGIMAGTSRPDYRQCVDISTQAALKEMVLPGILAVAAPVVVGLVLKWEAAAAFLMVGTMAGILLATVLNNGGGGWDNAKKFIESGQLKDPVTGVALKKGSEAHAAAVVGDTVGDPFKDTAGPSLHVLIKLLSTITLVLAPLFV